ncbi:hypothetical protein [uncultured Bosea sp.]|uniref:hypothetical protein n=1 Tax=uncultured Bosea sp. TaxID=211457 RepID=UPI00263ACFAB|nr:hypothetical protein [uncultured Bosea sp.]
MASPRSLPSRVLPSVSYGPFRQIGAVPWLLLAALMRVLAFGGGLIAVPAIVIADVSLLLAFVIVTWKMVTITNGQTSLAERGLAQQLVMTRSVLVPIFGLLIAATCVAGLSGLTAEPGQLMMGFDGIAFDQATHIGRLWSPIVAAIVLLMVLQVDEGQKPNLFRAMRELLRRAAWLVPGALLVAVLSILLHPVQGWFRSVITGLWFKADAPQGIKIALFFSYVVIFATIRLWLTVAILVLALRRSYRSGAQG